jgi:O-acetylhomoserine (thiol)-lyase
MSQKPKFETLALHAGVVAEGTHSRAVPLYRTASYLFDSAQHASDLFALKQAGNIYTRMMNPTQDILEKRMAALENGLAAVAVASGTSAVFYSIINVCGHGDEVVSAVNLYGGTHTLFSDILPEFGIKVHLVDVRDLEKVKASINDRTRCVFTEVIGNPTLDVADISALAKLAHANALPLIVDSTFTPPCMFRPIDLGADIVVHSLTKWLGGHGTGIGGIVIDSGKFDWTNPKFRLFNEPDNSYHGLRYAHDLGDNNNLAFVTRLRLVPLRNLGACISPDNAWMFLQGLETLALRMERHCENAMRVADYLSNHKNVAWVRYPGLENDPAYSVASCQFTRGFGGMVVFGIKGGKDAGEKCINSFKLISHVANVGDAKSLAIHPASTTHSQLTEEQQKAGGITPDLIRLSIGIEHIDDIIADLELGLEGAGNRK